MKEKIYKYLFEQQGSVSAEKILEKFFGIYGKPPAIKELIVDSILNGDERFAKDVAGKWTVKKYQPIRNFSNSIFTLIEFDTIQIEKKIELPILFGMLQFINQEIVYKELFDLEMPSNIDLQYRHYIEKKKNEVNATRKLKEEIAEIYRRLQQSILVSFALPKFSRWLNDVIRTNLGFEIEMDFFELKSIAKKIFPETKIRDLVDVLDSFKMTYSFPINIRSKLEFSAEVTMLILDKLAEWNITDLPGLHSYLESDVNWIDFSKYNFNREFINNLPESPGCYLMKDKNGRIFYVGMSKNLKSRLSSYFINRGDIGSKGKFIL